MRALLLSLALIVGGCAASAAETCKPGTIRLVDRAPGAPCACSSDCGTDR